MILWLDAQLSPRLCPWISRRFHVEVSHVRDLALRDADDSEIFKRARATEVVVVTKDEDFVELVERMGTPPQVLWLTCGNMSNRRLTSLLSGTLAAALDLLRQGEPIVEISSSRSSPEKSGRTSRSMRRRGRTPRRA